MVHAGQSLQRRLIQLGVAQKFQRRALEMLGDQARRRALGDDLAVVDDDEAVAELFGFLQVVRGEQDRLALVA